MNSASAVCLASPLFLPWLPARAKKARILAMKRDAYDHEYRSSSRLVDENMIVLRKRLHEMKMIERNYEAPSHWMEWEKQYYTVYDSIICKVVGILQDQLMNMRPSCALGLAALVTFSVPASTVMLALHLIAAANGVFSGLPHLN